MSRWAPQTATSQLVTRSTRHTCVSSHSQLVTNEHITKASVCYTCICAFHFWWLRFYGIFKSSFALCEWHIVFYYLLSGRLRFHECDVNNITVNSSQRRQTRRSTRHTIVQCDELTLWRVDWLPRPNSLLYIKSSSPPFWVDKLSSSEGLYKLK